MTNAVTKPQVALDAPELMVVVSPKETVLEINRKGCEFLGYREDQIIGKNWFDNFVPEPDRSASRRQFHRMLSGNVPREHSNRPVITRSGQQAVVAWCNTLIRDERGRIVGTLSSGEDITRQRRQEEEMDRYRLRLEQAVAQRTAAFAETNASLEREMEERSKAEDGLFLRATILDNAGEAILLVNPRGDLVYANGAACARYGFSHMELLSMNLSQVLAAPDRALLGSHLREALEKGHLNVTTVHLRGDGSSMPVSVDYTAVKTRHGRCVVAVVRPSGREFSPRPMPIEGHELPGPGLPSLPGGIAWTTDAALKVTSVSGATISSEELSERLMKCDLGEECLAAHRRALAGESLSYWLKLSSPPARYCARVVPLRDAAGRITGVASSAIEAPALEGQARE